MAWHWPHRPNLKDAGRSGLESAGPSARFTSLRPLAAAAWLYARSCYTAREKPALCNQPIEFKSDGGFAIEFAPGGGKTVHFSQVRRDFGHAISLYTAERRRGRAASIRQRSSRAVLRQCVTSQLRAAAQHAVATGADVEYPETNPHCARPPLRAYTRPNSRQKC